MATVPVRVFSNLLLFATAWLATSGRGFGGEYTFYNLIEGNSSFRIQVTGRETGRTASSPRQIGFQQSWTTPLHGGYYHIRLLGNGWQRDLGWYDLGNRPAGEVHISYNDRAWMQERVVQPNGQTRTVWKMFAAAPTDRKLEVRLQDDEGVQQVGGEREVLRPAHRSLGITFHICKDGVHIDSVTAGTPASRVTDRNSGENITLEKDDHIHSINGTTPTSIEEMQSAVQSSPQETTLVIKDTRTGKYRQVTVRF